MDETYIGGKTKRRFGNSSKENQRPRAEKFDMVLGMRERGGRVQVRSYSRWQGRYDPRGRIARTSYLIQIGFTPDSAAVYNVRS